MTSPVGGRGFAPAPLSPMPLVSVVIPTYGPSPFLAEALDSVSAQDYPNWECVVVDDGSHDPTAVEKITHEHMPGATVIHQPNAGPSAARNAGVQHSRGEVLAFLDHDDRWPPTMLSEHVAGLSRRPAAVASYGGIRSIDAGGGMLEESPFEQVDQLGLLRRDVMIITGALAVRRGAFQAVGGFGPRPQAEDLDLVLRLAQLGEFVHVNACLDYRTHGSNLSRDHRALAGSIREVVLGGLRAARRSGSTEQVRAHQVSLDRNTRFAMWSALRAARQHLREHRVGRAMGELGWAGRHVLTTPGGPLALVRRHPRREVAER